MKEANNFQRANIQAQGVAQFQLANLQPGVAYKSVAYKNACVFVGSYIVMNAGISEFFVDFIYRTHF